MRYAISVDPGKAITKCVGRSEIESRDHKVCFDTRYYDLKNGDIELSGNSYLVEYGEDRLVIGEQGEIYDTNISKTTLLHKLVTYAAISEIVKDDTNPSIVLTIGCPITIFKNKKLKEEYRKFIAEKPEVIINERKYKFNFERIIIKCEGSGIVYLEPYIFRDKRVAVIDIGGRNFNFGIYENLVPSPSSLFSNNYGGMFLDTMVKESLNSFFGMDCDLKTANKAIKEGGIILNGELNKESALIVKETLDNYLEQYILKGISEKNITINLMDVIAIGGTSSLLMDHLKAKIPHIIKPINNQQWSNVEGFQKVCLIKAEML